MLKLLISLVVAVVVDKLLLPKLEVAPPQVNQIVIILLQTFYLSQVQKTLVKLSALQKLMLGIVMLGVLILIKLNQAQVSKLSTQTQLVVQVQIILVNVAG